MRPFSDTGPIRSVTTVVSMAPAVGLERFNFNWSKTNILTLLIKYFDLLNKFISFLCKISQHNIFLIKFIQNPCPPQLWLKLQMYCMYCKNKPCYAGVAAYDTSDFLGNMHIQYVPTQRGGGGPSTPPHSWKIEEKNIWIPVHYEIQYILYRFLFWKDRKIIF